MLIDYRHPNCSLSLRIFQREAVYKTFKFTPYTVRTSLVFAVAIPLVAFYSFKEEDVRSLPCSAHILPLHTEHPIFLQIQRKWDWQGKKRSDSLKLQAPSSSSA